MDVLFAAYSNALYSVLLTNLYGMPVVAHSDFLYSVLPVVLLTNSHMPVVVHSDFSYSVSPVALLTNLHSVLPVAAHSKSMGGSALSAKRSSGDWILDTGATSHICCNVDLFDKIAPTSATIAWGNAATLPTYDNNSITVVLPNSASAILNSILYISELRLNILSVLYLLKYRARIAFI